MLISKEKRGKKYVLSFQIAIVGKRMINLEKKIIYFIVKNLPFCKREKKPCPNTALVLFRLGNLLTNLLRGSRILILQ